MISSKSGPKDQVALHALLLYFAFALVHDSRGIEIVNFTISLALSAGTLMVSYSVPPSAGPLLPLDDTKLCRVLFTSHFRHSRYLVMPSLIL